MVAYAKQIGYGIEERLVYRDAISALKFPYWERPALMKLWDDAERGEFDVVLCTEFFRLARKSSEQYAIMEYLKRFKVEVISITEKFEDSAEGRLLHAVQGFLGEVEAEKIRIRTTRGRQHRATRALTGQGATPIYGYVFVDGEEYKKQRYDLNLVVIARVNGEEWTEVQVVIYCFTSCLRGMSLRQIALALTRMGIPTQRGRDTWDISTVRQILKREALKEQVVQRNHSEDLEKDLATIKQGIVNLYKLAEVADPTDGDGMTALQDRLVVLERRKRDIERLLSGVTSVEERQEKLLAALDRFEAWAASVRGFLNNPAYVISNEDKISAILILGVKGIVWPAEGYPERIKFTLMPPDVSRFCDDDIMQLSNRSSSPRSIFAALCL